MSLKSDLYDVFTMNDMSNDDFADGIGKACKDFVASCTLTPTPSTLSGTDTSPTGAFTGAVTVISWQITGTQIASKIKAIMSDMNAGRKGDTDLAQAIADGLDADAPTWSCTISGSTTPPGSSPVPSADSGTITSTFSSAPVKSGLITCFNTMKDMINEGDDGDDYFATQLANLIQTYYRSSVNNGQGASHLAGIMFTVVVS